MSTHAPRTLDDVDWESWTAKDPATLLFVVKDGRILLIHKKTGLGAGKINGPGGRFEEGESAVQCAVRELHEELRVSPIGTRYCGENRFQFVDGYSIHVFVFVADDIEGEPTETEEAAPRWTPLDDIPWAEMWEDDPLWLPLALEGKGFQARYLFDGDDMLDYDVLVFPEPPAEAPDITREARHGAS